MLPWLCFISRDVLKKEQEEGISRIIVNIRLTLSKSRVCNVDDKMRRKDVAHVTEQS